MSSNDNIVAQEAEAAVEAVKSTSLIEKLDAWGSSAFPPMGLATLITALHARPLQPFPLLFAPALMFAGYVNVAGYAIDAAGMTAAWSGLYVLLSLRRRSAKGGSGLIARAWTPASQRTSTRRINTPARRVVSAAAMGLGTTNFIAGGVTYTTGDRVKETKEREERNRWGN
ncbi:hypothetical protein SEUCBS139899_006001 [Sporothrix eucalyptigena]|uniref:Altered inheritance of mitochondria protein 19 n=1 Tax=Sporothrix eucalyptigena TaxID=1812306 RepID=A0ABP0CYL0_9PEZI